MKITEIMVCTVFDLPKMVHVHHRIIVDDSMMGKNITEASVLAYSKSILYIILHEGKWLFNWFSIPKCWDAYTLHIAYKSKQILPLTFCSILHQKCILGFCTNKLRDCFDGFVEISVHITPEPLVWVVF